MLPEIEIEIRAFLKRFIHDSNDLGQMNMKNSNKSWVELEVARLLVVRKANDYPIRIEK